LKLKRNKILIGLTLLMFVSQVFSAPVVSCQLMPSSHSKDQLMTTMGLSLMPNHDMSSMHTDNSTEMECCENDCQCPPGMCVSGIFFPVPDIEVESSLITHYSSLSEHFQITIHSATLYRPPILS